MVMPIIREGKICGAHTTLLNRDTNNRIKEGKRMWGPIKGGYIPLGEIDPEKPLIVAVETALSASQIAGVPAIAALNAGNMEVVLPPPCSEIIIAADNDETGIKSANMLAQHLLDYGQKVVRIAIPVLPDWNEELRAAPISTSCGRKSGVRSALVISVFARCEHG